MAALGRIAESVLSDYRDALSPLLRELLSDLSGKKRPSATEAAERFRLAWYENSQEETPLPEELAPPTSRQRTALLGVAAIARPTGSSLSKSRAVAETGLLELSTKNVRVEVAPAEIVVGANCIENQGLP